MKIIYFSQTGNIARFVKKLTMFEVVRLHTGDEITDENFVLITNTTNFGEVPLVVANFLENNSANLIAVAGSGNRNWGDMYAKAVDTVAIQYGVPILLKFELSGYKKDIDKFITEVRKIEIS